MIAAMGYLAALLMVGKALHNLGKIAKVGWKGEKDGVVIRGGLDWGWAVMQTSERAASSRS